MLGLAPLPWACGEINRSRNRNRSRRVAVEPQPDKPAGTGGGLTAEPTGEGGGKSGEEPKTKPKPSGRPAILMGPSKKIASTFGATPGAVLKLASSNGTITWKIPEFSLGAGLNIEFSIAEAKAIKKGAAIGDVAILKVSSGDKPAAIEVDTRGDEFELRWPMGTQPSVNLAIGEANTDDQGDEVKGITWKIIAPKSVEATSKRRSSPSPQSVRSCISTPPPRLRPKVVRRRRSSPSENGAGEIDQRDSERAARHDAAAEVAQTRARGLGDRVTQRSAIGRVEP